jgi:hypothetical protein
MKSSSGSADRLAVIDCTSSRPVPVAVARFGDQVAWARGLRFELAA